MIVAIVCVTLAVCTGWCGAAAGAAATAPGRRLGHQAKGLTLVHFCFLRAKPLRCGNPIDMAGALPGPHHLQHSGSCWALPQPLDCEHVARRGLHWEDHENGQISSCQEPVTVAAACPMIVAIACVCPRQECDAAGDGVLLCQTPHDRRLSCAT